MRGALPGHRHPRARFTMREIRRIRSLAVQGWTYSEIALLLEEEQQRACVRGTIGKIVRGERYRESA